WAVNNSAKMWQLIKEIGRLENFKILFGKKDKKEVSHKKPPLCGDVCFQGNIWPEYVLINQKTIRTRTKSKFNVLKETYKAHAKQLVKTGGGIGDTENIDEDEMGEQLQFYIPADGPDDHTSEEARNLWEQITKEFEFFPALH
ncbi:hypothetical protein K439DRAFT_1254692, partial [Ramaria rubella]